MGRLATNFRPSFPTVFRRTRGVEGGINFEELISETISSAGRHFYQERTNGTLRVRIFLRPWHEPSRNLRGNPICVLPGPPLLPL